MMNKNCNFPRLFRFSLSGALLSLISLSAQALPIKNGSFEMTGGPVPEEIAITNLTGWSVDRNFLACVASDKSPTMNATTDARGTLGQSAGATLWASPGTSPDGGNFVLIDGDPSSLPLSLRNWMDS